MNPFDISRAHASRWACGCAVLTMALALAGCGGIVTVGTTVASGAEAVGTVVKDAIGDENKEKDESQGKSAKQE